MCPAPIPGAVEVRAEPRQDLTPRLVEFGVAYAVEILDPNAHRRAAGRVAFHVPGDPAERICVVGHPVGKAVHQEVRLDDEHELTAYLMRRRAAVDDR